MRPSLLLAAALVVTLGLKLTVNRLEPPRDGAAFVAAVERDMKPRGFAITVHEHPLTTIVHAARGDCRMMIADEPPGGTAADVVAGYARPIGAIHYAWRGRLRADAPRMVATIDDYARRELRRIGLAVARHPLAAIAANRACAGERIAPERLATLPR